MSRFDVPSLDGIEPEVGLRMLQVLARGDVTGQILVAKMAQEGMSNFMMRKVEYHLGELDLDTMADTIHAGKESVVKALAHESTHMDEIEQAYNLLITALEDYCECITEAIHQQARNN